MNKILHFSLASSPYAHEALKMYQECLRELEEIELCSDCYFRSNQQEEDDWFCEPCEPRHELVYAKAKGFPYWPAKANQNILLFIPSPFDICFLFSILGSKSRGCFARPMSTATRMHYRDYHQRLRHPNRQEHFVTAWKYLKDQMHL